MVYNNIEEHKYNNVLLIDENLNLNVINSNNTNTIDKKQVVGANDSFLFFTETRYKNQDYKNSLRGKSSIMIYDWSLKFINEFGQATNLNAPFYFPIMGTHLVRREVSSKLDFTNYDNKYFLNSFNYSKRFLIVVCEQTGKM